MMALRYDDGSEARISIDMLLRIPEALVHLSSSITGRNLNYAETSGLLNPESTAMVANGVYAQPFLKPRDLSRTYCQLRPIGRFATVDGGFGSRRPMKEQVLSSAAKQREKIWTTAPCWTRTLCTVEPS